MKKPEIRNKGIIIVATYLVPISIAILFSKNYWGYYFKPPSIDLPEYNLVSIDEIVKVRYVENKNDKSKLEIEKVLSSNIDEGALNYSKYQVDYPTDRLFYYVTKYKLKPSNIEPSYSHLTRDIAIRALSKLRQSGIIVTSEKGYNSSNFILGYIAVGKRKNGNNLVAIAIKGGQESNDHYPQYNVVYEMDDFGNFVLLNQDVYFEDTAGIEGARAYLVAVFLGILWTAFIFAVFLLYFLLTKVRILIKKSNKV